MNISVDGGALCTFTDNRFGNYTFTKNLLKALYLYDKNNDYHVYTYCNLESNMRSENFKIHTLLPKIGWMKVRISFEEIIHPHDVFLAVNQSLPLYTKGKKIVFSHGLSFELFSSYYKNNYNRLHNQLINYLQQADTIIVSSEKLRDEYKQYKTEARIEVLPFGIPFEFNDYIPEKRTDFFFFSGMNHPIKNIETVISVFRRFIQRKEFAHYRLYLSGPFLDYASDNIIVISHQTAEELINIYRTAKAYLSASLYESFNYPILEALSQMCPVIAFDSAVIPEMKQFVQVVHTEDEMLSLMIQTARKKVASVDRQTVEKTFSWKTYVKKLLNIYTK